MSKKRCSPVGAIRAGFDYQDLVALDIMVEWLEHHERFKLVKMEDDEVGSLDDVTAVLADGRAILRQSKFATDPDEQLTWPMLLAERVGKTGKALPSLLEKWGRTYLNLKQSAVPIAEACLYTNRRYDAELSLALNPQRYILIDRLTPDTLAKIERQLGGRSAAEEFFVGFQFLADLPSYEVYEAGLFARFKRSGGTTAGWTALKDMVRRWVRNKDEPRPGGGIELDDIRQAALWHSSEAYKAPHIGPTIARIEASLSNADRLATDVAHHDCSMRAKYGEEYDDMDDEERELMEVQWLNDLRLADLLLLRAFEAVDSKVLAEKYEAEVVPFRKDFCRISIRPYTGDYYVPVIDVMLHYVQILIAVNEGNMQ